MKAFSLTRKQVLDQRECHNEKCSEISDVRVSENKNENNFAPMMHITQILVENKIIIGLTHVWYYHAASLYVIARPMATP